MSINERFNLSVKTPRDIHITNTSVPTILRGLRELNTTFSNAELPEPSTSSSSEVLRSSHLSISELEELITSPHAESQESNPPILETILQLTTHVRSSLETISRLTSLVTTSGKTEASTQTEDLVCSSCGLYAIFNPNNHVVLSPITIVSEKPQATGHQRSRCSSIDPNSSRSRCSSISDEDSSAPETFSSTSHLKQKPKSCLAPRSTFDCTNPASSSHTISNIDAIVNAVARDTRIKPTFTPVHLRMRQHKKRPDSKVVHAIQNKIPKLRPTNRTSEMSYLSKAKTRRIQEYREKTRKIEKHKAWLKTLSIIPNTRCLRSASAAVTEITTENSSETSTTFKPKISNVHTVSSETNLNIESNIKSEPTPYSQPRAIAESSINPDPVVTISKPPSTFESGTKTASMFPEYNYDQESVPNVKSESPVSPDKFSYILESPESVLSDSESLVDFLHHSDDSLHSHVEEISWRVKLERSCESTDSLENSSCSINVQPVLSLEPLPTSSNLSTTSTQRSTVDDIIDAVATDVSILPRFTPVHLRPDQHKKHSDDYRKAGRPHISNLDQRATGHSSHQIKDRKHNKAASSNSESSVGSLQHSDESLHNSLEGEISWSAKQEMDIESSESPENSANSTNVQPVVSVESLPVSSNQSVTSSQQFLINNIIDTVASDLGILPKFTPVNLRPYQHKKHLTHHRKTGRPKKLN